MKQCRANKPSPKAQSPRSSKESPSDYLSHDKYGQVILESQVLDVPKIIDLCVIYGDANRSTVTKIVHSAFRHQPLFKDSRHDKSRRANHKRRFCAGVGSSERSGGNM